MESENQIANFREYPFPNRVWVRSSTILCEAVQLDFLSSSESRARTDEELIDKSTVIVYGETGYSWDDK